MSMSVTTSWQALCCLLLCLSPALASRSLQQQAQQQTQAIQTQQTQAANPSHTLTQSGPVCIDYFHNTTAALYNSNSQCATTVQLGFSATVSLACPSQNAFTACLNQSQAAINAWTTFVQDCDVLNVKYRTNSSQADTSTPVSCLPNFNSTTDFGNYLMGSAPVTTYAPAPGSSSDGGGQASSGGGGGGQTSSGGGGSGGQTSSAVAAWRPATAVLGATLAFTCVVLGM